MLRNFIDLLYPRLCPACFTGLYRHEKHLCTLCFHGIPQTRYHLRRNNPLERMLAGRIPFRMITAAYHFDKGARVQNLLHSIKYDGNKEAARFVGTWYGNELLQSELADADLIVPVPLHPSKLKSRGYNQSEEFGAGLSESMKIPMAARALRRVRKGDTQTKRGREERWSNVKDVFAASEPEVFYGKHVLVVDDVLTTGATLEACVKSIPSQSYRALSVATIAGVRKG